MMLDFTVEQVTEAYRTLGIYPLPGDKYTFERESDGLLILHAPFVGTLSMEFILEDAARQDEDLAEQLAEALESLRE